MKVARGRTRRARARWIVSVGAMIALAFGSMGCSEDESCSCEGEPTGPTLEQALTTIADIAFASYGDSVTTAEALSDAIDALLASPSADTLRNARARWLDAREPYGQTEAFRFQPGPIESLRDDGIIGDVGDGPEGRINAWPLAEAIIDYVALEVDGDPVTDPFPPLAGSVTENIIDDNKANPTAIDEAFITSQLFVDGEDERSVTTGYHAIEFLLWGQDLNADGSGSGDRDGSPGDRGFEDFLPGNPTTPGSCLDGAGANDTCDARRRYLRVAMDLLLDDLRAVRDQWAPGAADNWRDTFVAGGDQSLEDLVFALGEFGVGELSGERMIPANNLGGEQEDEHSCFSDNTHRDIVLNALGMQNIFLGRYAGATPVSGIGVYDVMVERGFTTEADAVRDALDSVMAAVNAISDEQRVNGLPFDVLIQPEDDPVVDAAIDAIDNEYGVAIEDAFSALFD